MDAGADVNLADPVVGTPLQSACSYQGPPKEKHESVICYLINEAKVDLGIVGGSLGCVFNAACRGPSFVVVRLMLEKGARIDVRDDMGRMAIHFAAARNMEKFQAILECGADVEVTDIMVERHSIGLLLAAWLMLSIILYLYRETRWIRVMLMAGLLYFGRRGVETTYKQESRLVRKRKLSSSYWTVVRIRASERQG